MPSRSSASPTPRLPRNRKQILWSLLVLLAAYAILWFREHSAASLERPLPHALPDTNQYLAERFNGQPSLHVLLGVPRDESSQDDILIERAQYVLSYNPRTKCANWVAWNQSAWWYGTVPRHRGPFLPDPLLPPQYAPVLHRDYTNSGFDRGHLVRSEERSRTKEDNLTTFYTTNIIPQTHALNTGPWLDLEEVIERLCKEARKELFIFAGPIYHDTSRTIIGQGVRVPAECFKIVVILPKGRGLDAVTTSTPTLAVRMANRPTVSGSWEQFLTSIRDIERATGYRFLTSVPDSIARVLKTRRTVPVVF